MLIQKTNYDRNWKLFKSGINDILNDNYQNISFQSMYTYVYNICNDRDINIDRFTKDLADLLKSYWEKLNSKNIKSINDILLFYTNKTGYSIRSNLTIEI